MFNPILLYRLDIKFIIIFTNIFMHTKKTILFYLFHPYLIYDTCEKDQMNKQIYYVVVRSTEKLYEENV